MDDLTNKKTSQGSSAAPAESERRRIGLVVHNDRGEASVEWHDAPGDYQRPVLAILEDRRLSLKDESSYDPYARHAQTLPKTNPGSTSRTDLRKLSEWIKMKRELEARKVHEDD